MLDRATQHDEVAECRGSCTEEGEEDGLVLVCPSMYLNEMLLEVDQHVDKLDNDRLSAVNHFVQRKTG